MKKITIYGSGCPTCQKLYLRVKQLIESNKITGELEYSDDINQLVKRGITGSPAIVVDEKVIYIGSPGEDKKLISLLKQ